MDTFGDRLKNFDIKSGSTTVVPIVFVFLITDDSSRPFRSCELDGGRFGNPGDDLAGIERENRRVRIHGVCVKNIRKVRGLEDGFREVRSEWVFIRTTGEINGTSAPTTMLRKPQAFLPGISPRLC